MAFALMMKGMNTDFLFVKYCSINLYSRLGLPLRLYLRKRTSSLYLFTCRVRGISQTELVVYLIWFGKGQVD